MQPPNSALILFIGRPLLLLLLLLSLDRHALRAEVFPLVPLPALAPVVVPGEGTADLAVLLADGALARVHTLGAQAPLQVRAVRVGGARA